MVQANLPLYSTEVPEDKRGETIELLERALLNQLGLKEKPKKPTREVRIPQHMLDLYNQQINDPDYISMNFNKETALHANTVRSFKSIGKPCIRLWYYGWTMVHILFHLMEVNKIHGSDTSVSNSRSLSLSLL